MNFEEVKRQEQENLMPTYGRFPVALVYGKGAVAVDTEGKEYIDFTSGIGVNSLGYCDDGWVSAVAKQAGAIQHMSNLYYSPVQTSLAAELCRLTGFGRVFFCNSGAEANECAIKLARKYSADKYGKHAAGKGVRAENRRPLQGKGYPADDRRGADRRRQDRVPLLL